MRRREFITLLGGAAAWPLAAHAQQGERVRRIGVLMSYSENDSEANAYLSGFKQGLQELGWTDGRNLRMDVRWAAGNVDRMQTFAKELVDLQPDVILSNTTPVTGVLQRETRTIPIVFVVVSDPVGDGFVASLARPGGNLTGFVFTEAEMGGKWLELLKEIAPGIKRAAIMFNPDTAPGHGSYYLPSFEAAARSLQVEPITAPVHSEVEIEADIISLGREPGGGLIAMGDSFMWGRRASVISIGSPKQCASDLSGSCLCQGRRFAFLRTGHRRYISSRRPLCRSHSPRRKYGRSSRSESDQVRAGHQPQAKALGLDVPFHFQQRADEVIE